MKTSPGIIDFEKEDLAWVSAQDKVYYSIFPKEFSAPSSAVVKLLQGIFDTYKDHSFFILRNRIFTTSASNPMDVGMVKLVAKKISFDQKEEARKLESLENREAIGDRTSLMYPNQFLNELNRTLDLITLPFEPETAAKVLSQRIPRGEILHDYDRPVAAVLTSSSGEILSAGVHSASINKTLHAEVNLIQSWFRKTGQKLPKGSHLHVTHKPCRMCAGMILHWSEEPTSMKVTWDEDVTGRHSRHQLL